MGVGRPQPRLLRADPTAAAHPTLAGVSGKLELLDVSPPATSLQDIVLSSRSMRMCVYVCGGVGSGVLIHAIFIPVRKIKAANFRLFSDVQVSPIFMASETREYSAKAEQMKKNM